MSYVRNPNMIFYGHLKLNSLNSNLYVKKEKTSTMHMLKTIHTQATVIKYNQHYLNQLKRVVKPYMATKPIPNFIKLAHYHVLNRHSNFKLFLSLNMRSIFYFLMFSILLYLNLIKNIIKSK